MTWSIALLAFVSLERLGELVLARHNTARLLSRGAVEHGAGHYPLIVLLHATWLGGLWVLAWNLPIQPLWLTVFLLFQVLRIWVLVSLGERWTTRIIVLPEAPLVARGPYRWLPHPNYAVVVGEIAVLPIVYGLNWYALVFSIANLAVLTIRVRAEEMALAKR
jgi:methyltransferase